MEKRIKNHITLREREIIKLVLQENSIDQISYKLHISRHTVITHKKNIYKKLNINSLLGLIKKSLAINIITIEDLS